MSNAVNDIFINGTTNPRSKFLIITQCTKINMPNLQPNRKPKSRAVEDQKSLEEILVGDIAGDCVSPTRNDPLVESPSDSAAGDEENKTEEEDELKRRLVAGTTNRDHAEDDDEESDENSDESANQNHEGGISDSDSQEDEDEHDGSQCAAADLKNMLFNRKRSPTEKTHVKIEGIHHSANGDEDPAVLPASFSQHKEVENTERPASRLSGLTENATTGAHPVDPSGGSNALGGGAGSRGFGDITKSTGTGSNTMAGIAHAKKAAGDMY